MEKYTDEMMIEALAMVGALALYNTGQISASTTLVDRLINAVTAKWGPGVSCDAAPEEMVAALINHLLKKD